MYKGFFYFDKVQSTYFFVACAFSIIFKNFSPNEEFMKKILSIRVISLFSKCS